MMPTDQDIPFILYQTDQFCFATAMFLSLSKATSPNVTATWGKHAERIYLFQQEINNLIKHLHGY